MASDSDKFAAEKGLFKCVQECNYDEMKRLITVEKVKVDAVDNDGMSALQHAAYKGDIKMCKLLLDCGADVNATRHTSNYSALTFASLGSGNLDLVALLLEHGASVSAVNSINKTATQMAAFVGNHHVVSVINNFIPIEKLDYFTKVQGLETEPKLPPQLLKPVHKMCVTINVNPVHLAMQIQTNPALLSDAKKLVKVFNIMSENFFKEDCNELLSLKFHHLACVLKACDSYFEESKLESKPQEKGALNGLIESWLKGNPAGFPVRLEKFLRSIIREYPFIECTLFQQLVHTLAPTKIGDEPSAVSIISELVTGKGGNDSSELCFTCGNSGALKKCSACHVATYCDKICQKLHWFTHKSVCRSLKLKDDDIIKSDSVTNDAAIKEANSATLPTEEADMPENKDK